MLFVKLLTISIFAVCLIGCTPNSESVETKTQDRLTSSNSLMQAEFMENCRNRREYQSRKRAGTLDKHCKCIFKVTMRGLSEDEQRTAAFYLYGESNEAFRERFRANPPNVETMPAAVEAVAKAAKSCR